MMARTLSDTASVAARGRVNREQIVDAAAQIADTDGLTAINTSRLATRLRIKPSSLYRHFPNIDGIRDALAARGLGELIDIQKDMTPGRQGRHALFAVANSQRIYAQARPGRYLAAVQVGQPQVPAIGALRQTYLRLTATAFESYQLENAQCLEVARSLLAAIQGFIVLELSGGVGTPYEADQSFQKLLDMLDAGARSAARAATNRAKAKGVNSHYASVDDEATSMPSIQPGATANA